MKDTLVKVLRKFVFCGEFSLRARSKSGIYVDVKRAYGVPGFLSDVSKEISKIINPSVSCIAGMGLGGIPLVSAYSVIYSAPCCFVREKSKEYGTKSQIEGYAPLVMDKVVIFDDVFTSGSSLKKTAEILKENDTEIIQGIVILKRGNGDIGFPVTSLLKLEDLLS